MHCPGKWLSHQPWRYLKGKTVGDLVLVEVYQHKWFYESVIERFETRNMKVSFDTKRY